jgi:hypothetical protein
MTKMTKAQRNMVLEAHASVGHLIGVSGVGYRVLGAAIRNGFMTLVYNGVGTPTAAGLIAVGVDMAAIETEALAEHDAWLACRAPAVQRYHRLVKAAGSFQRARDALHNEALTEDFLRQPHVVRAMEIGDAERERAAVYPPGSAERARRAAGPVCGRQWVAEIQLCPDCRRTAAEHA